MFKYAKKQIKNVLQKKQFFYEIKFSEEKSVKK